MTRHSQAGFTLLELMTAIALTTVLTGAMAGLVRQARGGAAATELQTRELTGFRRALHSIGSDLRSAQGVAQKDGTVTIRTADGTIVWSVQDGALERSYDGVTETVATSVVDLQVEPDGRLHRVRMRIGAGTLLGTAAMVRARSVP